MKILDLAFYLAVHALKYGFEVWHLLVDSDRFANAGNRSELDQMMQALVSIQEADPNFDLEVFRAAATKAFIKLDKSLDSGDFSQIRSFVSDGIQQRLAFAAEEQQVTGRSRRTKSLTIESADLFEVNSAKNNETAFEVISIRFSGTAVREYRVGGSSEDVVGTTEERVGEIWTFLRRRGAKTKSSEFGSIEGNCPNCGADISVNQWESCQACGSMVRSGEHDWVLSEISDPSTWKRKKPFKITSATRYWIKQDQGFSSHYLEDRASAIFFRKFLADRLGKIDPLGKVATDHFCDAYSKRLQEEENETSRQVNLEPRILAADVAGVIVAEPFDKALMCIRWSARKGSISRGKLQLEAETIQRSTMMVLVRQHGTKTRVERTITSSHCPKCGAPESNSASHSCDFCQTILNDGKLEWTMADMLPYTSTKALQLRRQAHEGLETMVTVTEISNGDDLPSTRVISIGQVPPEFTKKEVNGVEIDGVEIEGNAPMVKVRADDTTLCRIVAREAFRLNIAQETVRDFVLRLANNLKIKSGDLQAAFSDRTPIDYAEIRELDTRYFRDWLNALVATAMDGRAIEPWERNLVFAVAKVLGMSDYDVKSAIRATRWDRIPGITMEVASSYNPLDMLAWVVTVAAADGVFDPQERELLNQMAQQYGITESQVNAMCDAAAHDQLELPIPEDPAIARQWLEAMVDMTLSDGEIHDDEVAVLKKIADKIRLSQFDLKQLIRRRRSHLHQKAIEAHKAAAGEELYLNTDFRD